MPHPKMKIFKNKIFQNFFLFFSHPKPLKHLRKVENNFLIFFWRGVKKNLKVLMPCPKMKIFKKKVSRIFLHFFPTQNHLRKVENNFLTFFWRRVKKNLKVLMPCPKMKIFKKKFLFFFYKFLSQPKHLSKLEKVENKPYSPPDPTKRPTVAVI